MNKPPSISVQGLGKKFRVDQGQSSTLREHIVSFLGSFGQANKHPEFWALKEVSFEVRAGEVLGIIGKNGAGKSTLLKILSRITSPTEGHAVIHGRIVSLLEVGTGFHPELTGRENVFLNGAILGMKRSEIRQKFNDIVAFAEVEKFIDTPVKHYSSGMYVRLAFAVAAHVDPDILVVDEVLAVGDFEFQKKCIVKMKQVSSEGRTVLFVSNNMGIVAELCNRVILVENGRISFDGEKNEAMGRYLAGSRGRGHFITEKHATDHERYPNKIIEAWVENQDQVPKTVYTLNEAIVLRVRYQLDENVDKAKVAITLYRNGRPVCTTFSSDSGILHGSTGVYDACFSFSPMFLKAGSYFAEIQVSPSLYRSPGTLGFVIEDIHPDNREKGYREDLEGNVIAQGVWTVVARP